MDIERNKGGDRERESGGVIEMERERGRLGEREGWGRKYRGQFQQVQYFLPFERRLVIKYIMG
jgi:hypothetical protein